MELTSFPLLILISFSLRYPCIISRIAAFCGESLFLLAIIKTSKLSNVILHQFEGLHKLWDTPRKVLLCGDSSFSAIEDKLSQYDCIQLPHHGKEKQAEKIFESKGNPIKTLYLVSDNTGSTNGGSDKLDDKKYKGYRVKNTRKCGDIEVDEKIFEKKSYTTGKTLGV